MKRVIRNSVMCAIMTVTMVGTMCISAFAASDYDNMEKIGVINLDVSADYSKGDEIDEEAFSVSSITEGVTVEDFELDYDSLANEEKWTNYDTPVLTVYLYADDGYYFDKSGSKSSFKFTGDSKAEYRSADRSEDKSEMTIKVRVQSLNGKIGNVSNLFWDNTSVAHWTSGWNTKKYTVRLNYNGNYYKSYETNNTSWDFASDMTRAGQYEFSVRGSNSKSNSATITSGVVNITDVQANDLSKKAVDNTKTHKVANTGSNSGPAVNTNTGNNSGVAGPGSVATQGQWIQNQTGWWYRHNDGGWTVNNWELINGKWYFFNNDGYMMTGWVYTKNIWYYLGADGAMLTGWLHNNNLWYYLSADGSMLTNARTPDGYWVGADGVWR